MSITIGKYEFAGPYKSTEGLEDRSGIYAIVCKKGEKYSLIDVGESAKVRYRVENHSRKNCWEENCNTSLEVAVYYTPNLWQSDRITIEQEIRGQYNIPCGVR